MMQEWAAYLDRLRTSRVTSVFVSEQLSLQLAQGNPRPVARQTPTKTATRRGAKQAQPTKNVSCQSIELLA
jgi:hypothetical protein